MTGCSVPASGSPGDRESPSVSDADRQFLARFEQCTLPEHQWTHLAHIRVAWTCLNLAPPPVAMVRICEGILRYNTEVLNRRHKYNETVTVAFTRIVADRMKAAESWSDFAERINDLLDAANPALLQYYSGDRLFSLDARLVFVAPDLKELPPLPTKTRGSNG